MKLTATFPALLALASTAYALGQPATPQLNTFSSNVDITTQQAQSGGIDDGTAQSLKVLIDFERSNWATGSVATDPFYTIPSNASNATAGTALKVEASTNATVFTLPPNVALSRILYMTENLNGTAIPASAAILWPYLPRTQPDGTYPVIVWAHGTSGFFGECGPSHYRDLFYQYAGLFELALQGYVVVAPDYAGLGVNRTANGDPIYHPYLGNPSAANDIFYALQAAQSVFSKISKQFVVMGHSQGGAAAWASAIRQKNNPVPGYLGTVSVAPPTNLSNFAANLPPQAPPSLQLFIANGIRSIHPDFNLTSVLTPQGVDRLDLAQNLGSCNPSALAIFNNTANLFLSSWLSVPEIKEWLHYSDLGGQEIAGPMLVLQGLADMNTQPNYTVASVAATCNAHPDSGIEFHTFPGVQHFPTLFASQHIYLDWIAARFAGQNASTSCVVKNETGLARPIPDYTANFNYFLEFATQMYETQ